MVEAVKNATGINDVFQFIGGLKTRYVTSATEEVAELDGNRVVTKRFIAGPAIDERIAQIDANNAVKYIHGDKQNSVIALTNATGSPILRRAYGEYGETDAAQMAQEGHPFGYTGRRWFTDLGLYYYRARWYDPELGTFLETDPIGSLDYINLYSYVGLNPLNATDPSGKFKSCAEFKKGGGSGTCSNVTFKVSVTGSNIKKSVIVGLRLSEVPTKDVADKHYKSGDGIFLSVPVSSVIKSNDVNWKLLDDKGKGGKGKYVKGFGNSPAVLIPGNNRAQVLGSVTIEGSSKTGASIKPDTYNFEMHDISKAQGGLDIAKEAIRNIGTIVFEPRGQNNKPFMIYFRGSIDKED